MTGWRAAHGSGKDNEKEEEREKTSMKINHNMSAVITNHQLLNNENSLSVSMEKLSSGLRINHAKDDAAGMAISTKMRAQIQGLDQASRMRPMETVFCRPQTEL